MRLTTKGRYAVTAMLDLAFHYDGNPVKLADIAQRQEISLSYLEQLFVQLRRSGLVESTRGPGGGYCLTRVADYISVVDVISAVDEKVNATRCAGKRNCQGEERCLTHDLWSDLEEQISQFLTGVSLGQLLKRHSIKEVAVRQERIRFHSMRQRLP